MSRQQAQWMRLGAYRWQRDRVLRFALKPKNSISVSGEKMNTIRTKLWGIAFLLVGVLLISPVDQKIFAPDAQPWDHTVYLPIVMRLPPSWCDNRSTATTCAEEDNINIPMYSRQPVTQYRITATHPGYETGASDCTPDLCNSLRISSLADSCKKLADDGVNVLTGCTAENWWRPNSAVVVGPNGTSGEYSYIVLSRKIAGANSWPGFFVLYEDGYMRLIPHPKQGIVSACYGPSVIVGPANPADRPFVDIQSMTVSFVPLQVRIEYRDGKGSAVIRLSVDRTRAEAVVTPNYLVDEQQPFATYRSMFVENGKADVDSIQSPEGIFPILGNWKSLKGPWWKFFRQYPSSHNNTAPDILIEIIE